MKSLRQQKLEADVRLKRQLARLERERLKPTCPVRNFTLHVPKAKFPDSKNQNNLNYLNKRAKELSKKLEELAEPIFIEYLTVLLNDRRDKILFEQEKEKRKRNTEVIKNNCRVIDDHSYYTNRFDSDDTYQTWLA